MKSIIFDFNGTLFQDSDIHCNAWKEYLKPFGISITVDDFHKYMCGPPNEDILKRFIRPDLTHEEAEAMSSDKERIYRSMVLSDPALQHLTPGADEALDCLMARGVPIAIATGSVKDNVDFYVEALGIDRWFGYDRIFYAERDIPGKPDPTVYRLAMKKLGYAPKDTIVVEDGLPGIESAIGAGIDHIIAIDTTMGADSFKGIPQVRAIIHDFKGFVELIDRLYPINDKEEAQ